MSKIKFNQNDPKQVGSLGLHIMGINDMPAEKWLSFFTSEDMKKYALNDEQGFIGRLPPHSQERVMDLLTVGVDESFHRMVDRTDALLSGSTKAPISSVVKETVVTDKGVLTSTESLRQKLSDVYSIKDFGKVWVEALTLAGLDVDVEYVSNTGKKKLLSAMKAAIVSAVENTVDGI